MRLVFKNIDFEMELLTEPNVMVIENTNVFSAIVSSIYNQISGKDGILLLSDNEKGKKIDKKVELIVNPFAVNCNDRKIINKVYQDAISWIQDNLVEDVAELNASIVSFLEKVTLGQPYPLSYNLEIDYGGLLKTYGLKVDIECSDWIDNLISYIKLLHQVNGIQLFVFVNLKQYFNEKQLSWLYESVTYEQVYLLDIEGYDNKKRLSSEHYTIIDDDLCIIELN